MFKRKLLSAVVAATTVGFGGYAINASATDSVGATANITIIAPIGIAETTPMNFGSVAPSAASATTILLTPGGVISTVGGPPTAGLGGGELAGAFNVTGITNATYAVTLPAGPILFNGMTLSAFTSANTGTLTLGADVLTVGATLLIPAGQVAGPYSTPYTVTVEYN